MIWYIQRQHHTQPEGVRDLGHASIERGGWIANDKASQLRNMAGSVAIDKIYTHLKEKLMSKINSRSVNS